MARWFLRHGHDLGQNGFQASGEAGWHYNKMFGEDPVCVALGPVFGPLGSGSHGGTVGLWALLLVVRVPETPAPVLAGKSVVSAPLSFVIAGVFWDAKCCLRDGFSHGAGLCAASARLGLAGVLLSHSFPINLIMLSTFRLNSGKLSQFRVAQSKPQQNESPQALKKVGPTKTQSINPERRAARSS